MAKKADRFNIHSLFSVFCLAGLLMIALAVVGCDSGGVSIRESEGDLISEGNEVTEESVELEPESLEEVALEASIEEPDEAVIEDVEVMEEIEREQVEDTEPVEVDPEQSDPEPEVEPWIVSVLTINLRTPATSPLDLEPRTQMVADWINARQPDFVSLQEVTQSSVYENRAFALAGLTGYFFIWEPTHDFLAMQEGIGVLSRWPIVWNLPIRLPHPEAAGMLNRSILGVRAALPQGEVQFFSSHMTVSEDAIQKVDQAQAAFDFMLLNAAPRAGFFAGDLNATPDSLAMRFLRGDAQHQGRTGNLTDGWLHVLPDDPGFTFPADRPEKRIDYIYLIPGYENSARVLDCERVLSESVNGVRASDHLGVFCRFAMDPEETL